MLLIPKQKQKTKKIKKTLLAPSITCSFYSMRYCKEGGRTIKSARCVRERQYDFRIYVDKGFPEHLDKANDSCILNKSFDCITVIKV
jgi:hypothetical protein